MKSIYESRIETMAEGSSLLYEIIGTLSGEIKRLPGCRFTAKAKEIARHAEKVANEAFEIICKSSVNEIDNDRCTNATDDEDDTCANNDFEGLINAISELVLSDKPVSISADIYINEKNGEDEGE